MEATNKELTEKIISLQNDIKKIRNETEFKIPCQFITEMLPEFYPDQGEPVYRRFLAVC